MATGNITNIKISSLVDIGGNINYTSILPIDDLNASPIVTRKANVQILGNYILSQAGGSNFVQAAQATLAQSVVNAAQPNITSVGTLTSLDVSGDLTIDVASLKISGGNSGYVLQTDGHGNLSWTAQTGNGGGNGTPGGANTQVQFNNAGSFGGNSGFTFNKITGIFTAPFLAGDGNRLSNIQSANVSGLGNIATIALSGSNSNVLYGNGVWAPITATYSNSNVATFLAAFGSNTINTTGNISAGALTVLQDVSGNGALRLQGIANGNSTINIGGEADIDVVANIGNINLYTANNQPWIFDQDGNLTLPANTFAINYANGTQVSIGSGNASQISNGNSNVSVPTSSDNVYINTNDGNSRQWIFNKNGSLRTPGNVDIYGAINFPQQVSSINWSTYNIELSQYGRINTNVDFFANANVIGAQYLKGDGSNITNISIPKIANGTSNVNIPTSNGNVVITANGTANWAFGTDGNLTFPQGVTLGDYPNAGPRANTVALSGTLVYLSSIDGNAWVGVDNGTPSIGSTPTTFWTFGQDGNLSIPGGGSINTVGNGTAGITANAISGNAYLGLDDTSSTATLYGNAGVQIGTNGNVSWNFNASGNLTLPGNTFAVNYANGTAVSLGGAGNYGNANVATFLAAFGSNTISTTGNITAGNIIVSGTANTGVYALDVGALAAFLSNTVSSFTANVNNYTQVTLQNLNTGADATADFVITADNGSDTVNYADFGIINSGYDVNTPTNSLGNIVFAADTYLYAQGNTGNASQSGGNLAIGTTVPGKNVKIFAGGVNNSSIVANIGNTGVTVTGAISANGNITTTAGTFVGNGAGLTNVTVNAAGNIQGTSSNVSLIAGSYTYTFDNTGILTLPAGGGNEGAEIDFTKAPNSTLSGSSIVVDQYVDRLRFFESGGTSRGAYIDLKQAAAGVGTLLNNRISAFVNAGTFVTMDNIKATVTTSNQRGLSLATVSGTATCFISGTYGMFGGATVGGSSAGIALTTTPSVSIFSWGFGSEGDTATYILNDGYTKSYRITMMIGSAYTNNMISIERLI
jgi:hypothetical protein